MKRSTLRGTAASLLCVGLLTTGGAAFAQKQNTQSQPTQDEHASSATTNSTSAPSREAVMKNCVERERAGDSTMSESEARKACHDALRAQRDNQDNEPQLPHNQ